MQLVGCDIYEYEYIYCRSRRKSTAVNGNTLMQWNLLEIEPGHNGNLSLEEKNLFRVPRLKIWSSYKKWNLPAMVGNNPYPTAFPYGNGMVLHFYQQQESSTTKTVHKVINKGLKTYL